MIDAREYVLAQAAGIGRGHEAANDRPILVRNSRILIGLSFLGSCVAFCISLFMTVLACSSLFPLRLLNVERLATAGLWAMGAWIMAMGYVYLWRQGRVMSFCSVLLDDHGAHFKLDGTRDSSEFFLPWNQIAEVRHKRTPEAEKFMILGADTRTVTFTSYSFYRPRKVARAIAERAGLRVLRA